ncbi:hypothetical protein Q5H92_08960 [Hymenobacter sp. M29]|uniref:Uncharacterized protein n=1 Tax=Hymenobacter mellowenesis TaxID=3063995 RepID=A0ABT9ABC5_9BACT|nr:hypothetical protein [Hymenobacter sp. M29]MDO7846485.1 hypothetical protein [Hymenobacter sp. M29]
MSLGLSKSLRTAPQYRMGGVVGILAIATFQDDKTPGFTVQRDQTTNEVTGITPQGTNKFHSIDPEEASCSWADNLKTGTNKYRQHQAAFKYGEISNATSAQMMNLSLGHHTLLLKTKNGKAVLLGENNGLTAEKQDSGAGATNDDLAGHDLVLSSGETVHASIMPASVFDTIAATVQD